MPATAKAVTSSQANYSVSTESLTVGTNFPVLTRQNCTNNIAAAAAVPAASATVTTGLPGTAKRRPRLRKATAIQASGGKYEQKPAATASPQETTTPAVTIHVPAVALSAPLGAPPDAPANMSVNNRTSTAGMAGCGRQFAIADSSSVAGARGIDAATITVAGRRCVTAGPAPSHKRHLHDGTKHVGEREIRLAPGMRARDEEVRRHAGQERDHDRADHLRIAPRGQQIDEIAGDWQQRRLMDDGGG
ncbi:MAG: hypothetical protein AMXMBFR8_20470 [Nevskiales bacterium]